MKACYYKKNQGTVVRSKPSDVLLLHSVTLLLVKKLESRKQASVWRVQPTTDKGVAFLWLFPLHNCMQDIYICLKPSSSLQLKEPIQSLMYRFAQCMLEIWELSHTHHRILCVGSHNSNLRSHTPQRLETAALLHLYILLKKKSEAACIRRLNLV